MTHRAVFLDRDRTIIEDPGYISDPSVVKLLPGADLAIKGLRQGGYLAVVVTNQSAIARGLLTEEMLERIHGEMRRQLAASVGAHVDAIYYCPFHPEGTVEPYAVDSQDRKPQPGMLLRAAKDLDIDLGASWMVGDSPRDVEAGQRAGCRTIRIRVPETAETTETDDQNVQADFVVRNLLEAAKIILQSPPRAVRPSPASAGAGSSAGGAEAGMTDHEMLQEILRQVRELSRKIGKD